MKQSNEVHIVPSGFRTIDEVMNGYPRGAVSVIASRSSHGKSAYALNTVANMSKSGFSIMFFAVEMTTQSIVSRLIAGETGINIGKMSRGTLSAKEWEQYQIANKLMRQRHFVINDTANLTIEAMRTTIRRMNKQHKFDVVVVDCLQMLSLSESVNEDAHLSHMSRQFDKIAKEFNVAMLVVSQLNRPQGEAQNTPPALVDVDETLVEAASIVQIIYRDEVENRLTVKPNQANIIFAKHRNGPTGTVSLYFEKSLTKFIDASVHRIDLSDLEQVAMPCL